MNDVKSVKSIEKNERSGLEIQIEKQGTKLTMQLIVN